MNPYIFLGIAIIAEAVGTSFLKASEGFTKLWPSVGTAVGYGIAFYFLSLTLKSIPVGISYAIWSGVGIVLIATIGWIKFGQKLDVAGFAGIALIVAGVVVLNVFSKSGGH